MSRATGPEAIGDDFVALVNRDRRRRALLRPEPFGAAGIDDRHDLGREPFAQLPLFSHGRGDEDERRNGDADPTDPPDKPCEVHRHGAQTE